MTTFEKEFLCRPHVDPDREKADMAVAEYHERCEAFDRTVCRSRNDRGESVPRSGAELMEINRNAKTVMMMVMEKHGVTAKAFGEALSGARLSRQVH